MSKKTQTAERVAGSKSEFPSITRTEEASTFSLIAFPQTRPGVAASPSATATKNSSAWAAPATLPSSPINKITMPTEDDIIDQIARDHLNIETLVTQNSDSLDFHDVPVWGITQAQLPQFAPKDRTLSAL